MIVTQKVKIQTGIGIKLRILSFHRLMVCASRMSRLMLSKIKDYATTHKTLFFLEACFPSIAKYNKLKYDTPDELSDIVYRKDYVIEDFNKKNIFHPVKNINLIYNE
uniref:Uncharacterized protein n=1 Tax=viral metagenome TaxID=1070528 RepID=A0A6C0I8J2_9ZZZZ